MLNILHLTKQTEKQQGVAAVEFVLIVPILVMLVALPLFFGRVFMHYSVIQKAALSAAMYYATVPVSDVNTQARALEVEKIAIGLVSDQITELRPGKNTKPVYQVKCDGGPCGWGTPTNITMHIRVVMYDDVFSVYTWKLGTTKGIRLEAEVTVPYVGS